MGSLRYDELFAFMTTRSHSVTGSWYHKIRESGAQLTSLCQSAQSSVHSSSSSTTVHFFFDPDSSSENLSSSSTGSSTTTHHRPSLSNQRGCIPYCCPMIRQHHNPTTKVALPRHLLRTGSSRPNNTNHSYRRSLEL